MFSSVGENKEESNGKFLLLSLIHFKLSLLLPRNFVFVWGNPIHVCTFPIFSLLWLTCCC